MSDFDVFPLFPNEAYSNSNMYLSEFDINKQNKVVNKTQDIISLNDTPRYDIPVSATNTATELSRQIEPTNLGYPFINLNPDFKSGFNGYRHNNSDAIIIQPVVLYFILFIIIIFTILQYKAMKTIKKLTKQLVSGAAHP
jgi:hypothetical protein